MLKRFLFSCAAGLLLGSSALAVDAAGTYAVQTAQGPLVIDLRADQDHLSGTVHFNGQDFPVTAGQFGDKVNGVWECQGRPIPFLGSFDGTTLTINTNGATYQLQRAVDAPAQPPANANANPLAAVAPAAPAAPEVQPAQPQQAPQLQIDMQQGRVFRFAAPRGWQCNETTNGVDITAPDGLTGASHIVFRSFQGRSSPDQMMQFIIANQQKFGIANLRIVESRDLGPESKLFVTRFTCRGREVRGLSVCSVSNQAFGGFTTDCIAIQSLPESFSQNAQFLMQLAQSVTCVNPSAVCGNDQLIHLQPSAGSGVSLNHPNTSGDTIMSTWENRNRTLDRTNQNWSDMMRGQTRWGNGDTQYLAPNTATRVFVTPGGTSYYKTDWLSPPPPNSTEVQPTR